MTRSLIEQKRPFPAHTITTKSPTINVGQRNDGIANKNATRFIHLLPSRLYCRLWNHTRSTAIIKSPFAGLACAGLTAGRELGIPLRYARTLPRRYLFDYAVDYTKATGVVNKGFMKNGRFPFQLRQFFLHHPPIYVILIVIIRHTYIKRSQTPWLK